MTLITFFASVQLRNEELWNFQSFAHPKMSAPMGMSCFTQKLGKDFLVQYVFVYSSCILFLAYKLQMFGSAIKEDDITSSNKMIDCTTTIYTSECDLLEILWQRKFIQEKSPINNKGI
jgi:hypothetical protein